MNIEDVISLTNNDECGHIEYKREWYINDNTVLGNQKRWGEIIKDIVAIANANLDSVGMDRYIIFGFDESEKKFYNTKITIDEFNKIKKQIKEKINKFVSGDIDILFYHFYHEGCFIFLFKIKQHNCLFELKNDIQTKTLVYKKGTVLTRGIETAGKSDSIGPMSPDDIIKYKNSLSFMFKTISPESLPKIKSISETIKIYLENSNALMLENDYPKKSNNIKNYFEIYKIRNRIHGNIEYFVYLNEQASQLSTLNEIKKEEKFSVEPYLLTNKPFNLKDPETRIQNLKKYSGWKKVGFIDDFGKQYLYKEPLEPFSFSKFKSNTIHFIHSLAIVSSGEKHEALTSMDKWFAKDDIPIMVVTGEGGIGKTTLVKEFLNLNLQEEKDYLLFLDSETVISNITTGKILDIYDLYKIIIDEGYKEFNRNLFKLCIDNGTLLVVIDGLDEVVSRLGTRFNLNEFIQSIINNYSFNLTRAKILITCRDSIWNNYKENKSEKVNEIKLLPFTEEQTREYFNETIKVSALAKKAFSFVEKLKTSINENGYFSPFILDTVQRLINQDKDSSNLFTIDPDLSSQYPLDDSSTDFLIIKVLHREAKKNPFWSVEKQIKVFIEISNIDKSGIVKELLEEKIKKNLDIKMEAKDYSSLLSHQ
uniref:NACHT domain-containing protein n=1 Tax=Proteus mirabilis TaxID=584 RepID=UPI001B36E495